MNKIEKAVKETKGEYVDYNGKYADTLFFSTSVGNTENSEEIFGTKISYLQEHLNKKIVCCKVNLYYYLFC